MIIGQFVTSFITKFLNTRFISFYSLIFTIQSVIFTIVKRHLFSLVRIN
nr:MAG TPA: hypothetical protein [Caudoviricetes sp.]